MMLSVTQLKSRPRNAKKRDLFQTPLFLLVANLFAVPNDGIEGFESGRLFFLVTAGLHCQLDWVWSHPQDRLQGVCLSTEEKGGPTLRGSSILWAEVPCGTLRGKGEARGSIHLILLPPCGHTVTSHLTLLPSHLLTGMDCIPINHKPK